MDSKRSPSLITEVATDTTPSELGGGQVLHQHSRLGRADQRRRVLRDRPDLGAQEGQESVSLVGGVKLEVNHHVRVIALRVPHRLRGDAGPAPDLGEPAEGRCPRREVSDGVLDV